VIAELVSTDDGYASANGRDEVLGMGVKDISISRAKGKKLTALTNDNYFFPSTTIIIPVFHGSRCYPD